MTAVAIERWAAIVVKIRGLADAYNLRPDRDDDATVAYVLRDWMERL